VNIAQDRSMLHQRRGARWMFRRRFGWRRRRHRPAGGRARSRSAAAPLKRSGNPQRGVDVVDAELDEVGLRPAEKALRDLERDEAGRRVELVQPEAEHAGDAKTPGPGDQAHRRTGSGSSPSCQRTFAARFGDDDIGACTLCASGANSKGGVAFGEVW
jgi:hypothetical protein